MPEMPEVETIARRLRKTIIGKRISEVLLSGLPLRRPILPAFDMKLRNRTIRKVHRRGKYLIIELDPHAFWLIHLGMSGRLFYGLAGGEAAKHTHAAFRFGDTTELQYRDHRRFGLLAAYEVSRLAQIPELRGLGIDPLSSSFSAEWLWSLLRESRQEIKSFLLDQRKIAGLGNIYACETLFLARINPERRCFALRKDEAGRLVLAIRRILREAIRHRGTSFSDFIDLEGTPGSHQDFLHVFQREGEMCSRCNAARIERLRQGNRSSFFCPRCQT